MDQIIGAGMRPHRACVGTPFADSGITLSK
jgi:hypothetical protein